MQSISMNNHVVRTTSDDADAPETVWEKLEYLIHTITVRKIWWLTNSNVDVPFILRQLAEQDYTVAMDTHPCESFLNGSSNTLVTDWLTYADAQDAFRCILPSIDIVVLHDLSELDMAAWKRWAELSSHVGCRLNENAIIVC